MTRTLWPQDFWRWILAVFASVVAFYGVLFFSFIFLFFGSFPQSLAEPTAGFILSAVVVLAGSFMAPHHRVVTAIILCLLVILSAISFGVHAIGASVGGLIAVTFVTWWFHPRRTARSTSWVAAGAVAAFFAFVCLVYARHVDRPAHPDQLPFELTHVLGTNGSRGITFYGYDLGGFIDHQWLWRIDTQPDTIALIVKGLDLRSTNTVPQRFWRRPPYYWPRSLPPSAEAFQSPSFFADNRGPDGDYYF